VEGRRFNLRLREEVSGTLHCRGLFDFGISIFCQRWSRDRPSVGPKLFGFGISLFLFVSSFSRDRSLPSWPKLFAFAPTNPCLQNRPLARIEKVARFAVTVALVIIGVSTTCCVSASGATGWSKSGASSSPSSSSTKLVENGAGSSSVLNLCVHSSPPSSSVSESEVSTRLPFSGSH